MHPIKNGRITPRKWGYYPAKAIKDIHRATRKQYSAEGKIRIVLDGLRGEEAIAEFCRREGIAHISPLGWEHITLTGEYQWPKA